MSMIAILDQQIGPAPVAQELQCDGTQPPEQLSANMRPFGGFPSIDRRRKMGNQPLRKNTVVDMHTQEQIMG